MEWEDCQDVNRPTGHMITPEEQKTAFLRLLDVLGLKEYYPQKLNQSTVLKWFGQELKTPAEVSAGFDVSV